MAFKQFDIVTDYSDHYYLKSLPNGSNENHFINNQSSFCKRIMKEWRILENNLPNSIFVRVYEGRIDFLRAVIIGASGTPYHDGLFFFDFAFPADYPNRPPSAYYHSHGLCLNPNLYSNGKVCLSLLNTWDGKKEEKWNPSRSTMLQVLLSLQALVLNENPYYNEPILIFGLPWQSNLYNEYVFLSSCKSMLYLWRNPPRNFEWFVKKHFRQRSGHILSACKAYIDGNARVGCYQDVAVLNSSSSTSTTKLSGNGKKSMEKVHSLLDAAFNRNEDIKPDQLLSFQTFDDFNFDWLWKKMLTVFILLVLLLFIGSAFANSYVSI